MAYPVGLTDAHIDLSQLTGVEVVSVVGVVARDEKLEIHWTGVLTLTW